MEHESCSETFHATLSIGWLVGQSRFKLFYDLIFLTPILMPKLSNDLKYGPCPPARDFGSRVSGLVPLGRILFQRTVKNENIVFFMFGSLLRVHFFIPFLLAQTYFGENIYVWLFFLPMRGSLGKMSSLKTKT